MNDWVGAWLTTPALAMTGFSLIIGPLLLLAYLRSEAFPYKTAFALAAAAGLTLCLFTLQVHHLHWLTNAAWQPLTRPSYLAALFLAPAMFLYFGRAVVLPQAPLPRWLLLPLLPVALPLLLPLHWAMPCLFAAGALYALWLSREAWRIRAGRRQHRFELLFSIVVTLFAAVVLIVGSALPWLPVHWYFLAYATCIGGAYALVTFALTAIPDFVNDLFEVTRARYSVSTLTDVDVPGALERLQRLMSEEQLFRTEDLTLARLAEALDLSSHQLSELLNSRLGTGFSAYLRQHRVNAARARLLEAPGQSVLSVGLESGFSSQSSFYAAFKATTGTTPGEYRKANIPGKSTPQ